MTRPRWLCAIGWHSWPRWTKRKGMRVRKCKACGKRVERTE